MTRFVVDSSAILDLASKEAEVSGEHELLAPTLLRSQALLSEIPIKNHTKPGEALYDPFVRSGTD